MTGMSRQPTDNAARTGPPGDAACARRAAALASALLSSREDDLVDQSIAGAKMNGYAPYTTTIRAAWVEAVRSLTEALGGFLADPAAGPRGPQAEISYRHDKRFARMRMIARKHRAVGITLEMYLGLFKHFRRVYLDALGGVEAGDALRAHIQERTLDFFDETELSVTADWTAAGGNDRLQELQAQARTLTLAKDRYIAIFESLRNPACLLDHARGLVHANQAALDLFIDETEAGDSLYRHGRRALVARVEALLGDVLDRDDDPGSTVWIETVAGRRCFDIRLLRLHDAVENTSLGYLVQLYDITAYHDATETAQRAEAQMSRFLATMSHEIRTPLHAVLGAADLMRHSDDAMRGTYLDVIQSAGRSLLQTLNNVLDYTKLGNGPPTPRPVDTEIGPALQAFCGMAIVGPEANWTRLSLAIAPSVPAHVRLDWAMTRQILTNLVSNALRHDGGDGVVLRAGRAGPCLRFEVVDHGPGLPPEDAAALYRPFDEVSARPTDAGGTGLGLAISRYLVVAMGGQIDYETSPRGTRIWVDLPFTPVDALPAAPAPHAFPDTPPGRRCLLVDDDEIGAPVTARQLERAGFVVDQAMTLQAARAAYASARYDAVVIDYLLPDGTGPDLLADLRHSGRTGQTRFVALTANVEALNESRDLRTGFARILAKPTDAATLAEALTPRSASPDAAPGQDAPRRDGLDGLSTETIAAMAAAFALQWTEFRQRLRAVAMDVAVDVPHKAARDALLHLAHRLAGSSAQLGLIELETPLRDLEACLDTTDDPPPPRLVARLDQPLDATPSWRRLPLKEPAP